MRHYDAYGGPKPPPIDHQGIDDAFVEKASVVHYFHRGKVVQVTRGGLTPACTFRLGLWFCSPTGKFGSL